MTTRYYNHVIKNREVFIDYRFDRIKVLKILEEIFEQQIHKDDGYLRLGKIEFAELIDAKLYPFFPTVNTQIDSDSNIYYTIYIEWDEEMIYRECDNITSMVHNVLRGLPA